MSFREGLMEYRTGALNGELDGESRHQYSCRPVEAALNPTLDSTTGWIHTRYTTSELAPNTTLSVVERSL